MNRPPPRFCPQCGAPLTMRERFGRPRPVCTVCDGTVFIDPKVAVAVLITRGEEVLLVQRANDPGRGKWALPAGFIDPDEDPRAAAVREAAEETGLEIEITGLIGLFHRPDKDGLADLVIAYSALPVGGSLQAGDDASAARWIHAAALDDLPTALATTGRLLVWWRERLEPDL